MSGKLIRKCAPGTELVDWLMNLSPIVHTRAQAAGMWQALLEEGVVTHGKWKSLFTNIYFLDLYCFYFTCILFNLVHFIFIYCCLILILLKRLFTVNKEQPFKDKCFLYRFRCDEDGTGGGTPSTDDINTANDHIRESLGSLLHRGPDATLRMILRKP